MVKNHIFDHSQLLRLHPDIPHYQEDIVCFESNYEGRTYPAQGQYFNKELYMILILQGTSEIRLNGEHIRLEPDTLLLHGANYLTDHLSSGRDIRFITLSISESMRTNDSYLTRITAILLATMRREGRYTIPLTAAESRHVRLALEELMRLMQSKHAFLFRRIQAACNALFLDIGDFLSRKTPVHKQLSPREHVLQDFHALVTRHFREEHFVKFYAARLAISEQYLARILRAATGKSATDIINELLTLEAQHLLESRRRSVAEISERLHFSDTSAFCKFFKRNTGLTPLAYRHTL